MSDEQQVSIEELQQQLAAKDEAAASLQQQLDAVKGKADQLLDETKKAKAKAREEAEAKQHAEKQRAEKAGDFEQLLKSSEAERAALSEQLNTLNSRVGNEKRQMAALKVAAELADGANAELLSDFVAKRLKYTDEGLKVVDRDGNLTVSSLDDLKNEFNNNDKFKALLRGNKSSGGGAPGNTSVAGGDTVKTITRSEFDSMDMAKKSAYIRKGNKVAD